MVEDGLRMTDKEREALDQIAQFADEVPRIEESLFVARYLPILASRTPNTDLTPWLQVVGNPYRSCDVFKDGQVLFRVPPIFRRIPTKLHRSGMESVLEIVETSKLHAAQHPRVGQHYLEQHLKSSIDSVDPEDEPMKQWNDILARYGYDKAPPDGAQSVAATVSEAPKESENLFDGGFEEL